MKKQTIYILTLAAVLAGAAFYFMGKEKENKMRATNANNNLESGDGKLTSEYLGLSKEEFEAYQVETKSKIDIALGL